MKTKEIKINIPEGYEIDKENSTFECIKIKKVHKIEYVDLGLPSGTLWASENADDEYHTFEDAVEKFKNQLPTRTQFCELLDYTTHKWDVTRKGIVFVGKNGNELFFPAVGFRFYNDGSVNGRGDYGYYWSSSVYGSGAWGLGFSDGGASVSYNFRAYGYPIRLVKDNFK